MHKNVLLCIIVDDEPLAQQVLENYIQRTADLKLVAKCESVEEAIETLKANEIDIVFLDLDLKTTRGTEVISKMKGIREGKFFIVITSAAFPANLNSKQVFTDDHIVLVDYLTKPFSLTRFQDAIRKVVEHFEKKSPGS
jgi:two-component system LytT family response regulator